MTLTNQDPEFYPLLGPYLSRREIVAELGGSVWDDDGKVRGHRRARPVHPRGEETLMEPETLIGRDLAARGADLAAEIALLDADEAVRVLNTVRVALHRVSPLRDEPVDCVLWVPAAQVQANDYNPNTVAPPEMRLLEHSIQEDGYTQPVVAFRENGHFEVVDGFHRNRVGRECATVRERVRGYLPVTVVNEGRTDRADRIAATIRHNRA
ncbi:MAG TPA: ParB/RepB/Spo0J family partition protein, partial [Armatimonadota bacterium]|nr:ParB/RepB/Spo0J family partition protein [Armatimonadota bacterium]